MVNTSLPLAAVDYSTHEDRDPGAETAPLVILHGLLASSRHWRTAAAELASRRSVFALDLRNHGRSPRSSAMNFPVMVADLLAWLDARGIAQVDLLGHSMGGKLAMAFACRHPERVRRLVVVDISPRHYHLPSHISEFRAMHELRLDALGSRADAELRLEGRVSDPGMRRFLAGNLERDADAGGWKWNFDLYALTAALPELKAAPLGAKDQFAGPSLFLAGESSPYVRDDDVALIRSHFTAATIRRLPRCGHNPHLESRADFLAALESFLDAYVA